MTEPMLPFPAEEPVEPVVAAPPPDQAARDRTEHDLGSTLFVEAGAGSGKTRALVQRIVALVDSGVELQYIAAITFTEKAANELRQRVRDRLTVIAEATGDRRFQVALDQLDGAAISTLHAFAQRLLFEHPIEAGLPPGVEVLDEIASQVDFDERWDAFLPDFLRRPEAAAPLLIADVLGVRVEDLRALARQLETNWDLVHERLPPDPPALVADIGAALAAIDALDGLLEGCDDHDDTLVKRIGELRAYGAELAAVGGDGAHTLDDLVDLAELLVRDLPRFATSDGAKVLRNGSKTKWRDGDTLDRARQAVFDAGVLRNSARDRLAEAAIKHLARQVGDFVLDAAEQRRREGRLLFHDLLVLARELLRSAEHGTAAATALAERYRRLLIDEFQDTDPIQVELATLIAARADVAPGTPWTAVDVRDGALFFVGDPKQSIYRFRRADIGVYLRAQEHFGAETGNVALTTNFRSSPAVIDWVNRVFTEVIEPHPGSQPHYTPLHAHRSDPPGGPGVVALGAEAATEKLSADALRRAEAHDVVRAVTQALHERWPVADRGPDGTETWRDPTLGDITILLPARTSLLQLEQALERAGIPYRAETASLVYATTEVRTLLLVARAIDDPTDELAVVAALRSHAFGCGDDDLLRYYRAGGAWNHQALPDEALTDDIVARGLGWMARQHHDRAWRSPAQTLDAIVSERRLLELGVTELRHREVWRRIRFVIDQARAWTDTTGGSLREYLAWVRLQASESSRVVEAVLPETDTDAVRIMTVHASKGLEFPITIVSGLTTRPRGRAQAVTVLWPGEGEPGFRMRGGTTTPEYDAFAPIDEMLDEHERRRLLYVACTRAQDHLVVSLHRTEDANGSLAETLAAAGAGAAARLTDLDSGSPAIPEVGAVATPPARDEWRQRRDAAMTAASEPRTVSATAIAAAVAQAEIGDDPGIDKRPRNLDLPPWQKGRYGSAVGRAVHGVLQSIDLAGADGVAAAAAAQAAAEGVVTQADVIEAMVRQALASRVVAEARGHRYWREMFVAAPIGDRVLEGYIDLLYQRDDGLVIVDYKTDAYAGDADLEAKVARYRPQIAAYAVGLISATGLPVAEAVLLFLRPESAVARIVPDLDGARAEVVARTPSVTISGEARPED